MQLLVEYNKQFQMNYGYYPVFWNFTDNWFFMKVIAVLFLLQEGFFFFFLMESFSLVKSTVLMTEDVIHCAVDC